MSDETDVSGVSSDGNGPSEDGTGAKLPPPAFPPGKRRLHVRRRDRSEEAAEASEGFDGAFISPDEPLPERTDFPDDAFISPDEPIQRVQTAPADAFISPDEPLPERGDGAVAVEDFDADDVVVTGMGDDAHLDPEELAMGGDPYLMELSAAVSKLAGALKSKGEAGLRAAPEMSKFETTLRAYCVGYLAGRRAEEDLPELEESETGSW